MRIFTLIAVFVIAILASQRAILADDQPPSAPPETAATVEHYETHESGVSHYNGYDRYRRQPDTGSPAHGFKHFAAPMHAFTTWYRPRAATLTAAQRCAPEPFRPRGFGNLFAKPCDPFRMEYNPHVLSQRHSNYGPSYLLRMCDPRCEDCHDH